MSAEMLVVYGVGIIGGFLFGYFGAMGASYLYTKLSKHSRK